MQPRNYTIKTRWFDGTWQTTEYDISETYENAAREAMKHAREMDRIHGNSHSWNVELWDNPKGEYGAYYEWFHGRTN